MKRQKDIAEANSSKEIGYFSNMTKDLICLWKDQNVSEVLHGFVSKGTELESKIKKLSQASASLGSMRQELAISKTVSVMVEFVDLLTNRNTDLHGELVIARKILDDNNIAIEKPEESVAIAPGKTRSVSLVCQPSTGLASIRRVSCKEGERSKSVTEAAGEILENNNVVRKKSRKSSLFATISEHGSKDREIVVDDSEFDGVEEVKRRKKSSKKVSIAENLNCDYSDSNISEVDEVNTLVFEDKGFEDDKAKVNSLSNMHSMIDIVLFYFVLLVYHCVHYPCFYIFITLIFLACFVLL